MAKKGEGRGEDERGFLRGLQTYGDRDFSIYMRRAFAKSMGYSGDELSRPVVGIAFTHKGGKAPASPQRGGRTQQHERDQRYDRKGAMLA